MYNGRETHYVLDWVEQVQGGRKGGLYPTGMQNLGGKSWAESVSDGTYKEENATSTISVSRTTNVHRGRRDRAKTSTWYFTIGSLLAKSGPIVLDVMTRGYACPTTGLVVPNSVSVFERS